MDNENFQSQMRTAMAAPKVLILGHGRHGKDTVAEVLEQYGLTGASSSQFVAGYVRDYLQDRAIVYYPDPYLAWEDRHNFRASWRAAIDEYNRDDPARLTREILTCADIYTGMRTIKEYEACKDLFDVVLWVDASERLPLEPESSMELEHCAVTMRYLDNNGTVDELIEQIDYLVEDLIMGVY